MADSSAKDPAAVWQDLVAQWEKGVNSFANQAMATEEFSGLMHKATSASVGLQQSFGALMGRYLAALNLPSRAEMTSIGERLQAIEASLSRIEARIGQFATGEASGATPPPRPPRTKQPRPTPSEDKQ